MEGSFFKGRSRITLDEAMAYHNGIIEDCKKKIEGLSNRSVQYRILRRRIVISERIILDLKFGKRKSFSYRNSKDWAFRNKLKAKLLTSVDNNVDNSDKINDNQ